jgi:hypothetical protein
MTVIITCPDCGTVTAFDQIQRDSTEFCQHCDYPLFWARPDGPTLVSTNGTDVSRRRLPGTGGRLVIGSRPCPVCGEQNPLNGVHCIRCSSLLDPPPVVATPAPQPPGPPALPPPPVPAKNWWPWIALGVGVVILLVGLGFWIW